MNFKEMSLGKKIGFIAFIITIICVITGIIAITQAPEIPDEVFQLMLKDSEAGQEMMNNVLDNGSTLFKVSSEINFWTAIIGFVAAIVSFIISGKNKEKGRTFAVISILIIPIFCFIMTFAVTDMGKAVKAGMDYSMEYSE